MKKTIGNIRINKTLPLIPPIQLTQELPINSRQEKTVIESRKTVADILNGKDERLLVVLGPCSVHDTEACLEYANRLNAIKSQHPHLYFVMRVYFEKPRTIVGWKGLINDPSLNGQFMINEGLHLARKLLLDITQLGLPVATEFLDTTFGQYYSELVSLGAIGARTVESQIHRELASGLSMPVGFKNRTDGDTGVAMDAIRSANHPHSFPSISEAGDSVIFTTTGNPDACLILRGGNKTGTNYHDENIRSVVALQNTLGIDKKIIVDCSHGNSHKDPNNQALVVNEIVRQHAKGLKNVGGIMLESFLKAGRQDIRQDITDPSNLVYGQSITDACLSFDDTLSLLNDLEPV